MNFKLIFKRSGQNLATSFYNSYHKKWMIVFIFEKKYTNIYYFGIFFLIYHEKSIAI